MLINFCDKLVDIIFFLISIYSCIQWNDSNASLKACLLAGPVIRQLASDHLVTSNLANVILTRVLQGLQLHGHHDANHVRNPYNEILFEIIILTSRHH